MALLTLKKGSSSNLDNVIIKDGQLLVTTDTKNIYLDNGTVRLHLTSDYLTGWPDTRNDTTVPNDYNGIFKVQGIKTNTATNLGVNYATLIGFRGWTDSSGGNAFEFAFTSDGFIRYRKGATDTWGDWYKVYTANDKPTYSDVGAPSTTGTNASGTWNININGNASSATSATYATRVQNGDQSIHILYNDSPFATFNNINGRVWGIERHGTNYEISEHYYINGTYETSRTSLNNVNYSNYALPLTGGTLTGSLVIFTNGKYYQIGCQNSGWAHHNTDATSGHWFNTDVAVQGNIYCGSGYNTKVLTVAGDRMTGTLTHDAQSTSWIDMTHGYGAIIYKDKPAVNGGATACWAVKTNAGAWGCGNLSGNDNLYFVWGSDENYNAGINSANSGIYMAPNGVLYGAAWNDYAEFRIPKNKQVFKPGTCVIEVGDDTLIASTERMQAGALIVSDTFGFAIGETKECTMPIATSGRVLAIPFEPRESYLPGDPVCSGPNGTVSKMSEQEVMMYPHKMIGTVSAIPSYTHWGSGNVEVNGRIWIQIR